MNDRQDNKHGGEHDKGTRHHRKLSRRETLKWVGVMSTTVAIPMTLSTTASAERSPGEFAPWPELTVKPVTAAGYGQDPNLIVPEPGPWPRILTAPQLAMLAVISDIIVPAEDEAPSASEVGVPEVLDEWISAPYPRHREHRSLLMPGFLWMDDESNRRFRKSFIQLSESQKRDILDDIAFSDRQTPTGLEMPKAFFSGLRSLIVGAFFTSPAGMKDLGYIGNTPIYGDYPGPTPEAMAHLETLIDSLGLSPGEVGDSN